jgi:hypothetical protein
MRRGLSSYFRRLLYCIKQYSTVQQARSLVTSPNLNVPLKDQPDFDVPMGNEGSCTSATITTFTSSPIPSPYSPPPGHLRSWTVED